MAKMIYTLEHTLSRLSPEDLKILVANSKRSNKLMGVSIEGLIYRPYWFVKVELLDLIRSSNLTELIQKFTKAPLKKICKQKHSELFSFVMWVKDELEAIYKLEGEYLSSPPDIDLINAGIRELDELGEFNTIDNLVKEWNGAYTHEDVKAMPYHFIFDKLRKNNIEAKTSKQYNKIISDKQKKRK